MPTEKLNDDSIEKTTIDAEAADLSSVKCILDACVKSVHAAGKSRELSIAATNIQQARLWIEEHQRLS